jgi:hypothetical protein
VIVAPENQAYQPPVVRLQPAAVDSTISSGDVVNFPDFLIVNEHPVLR